MTYYFKFYKPIRNPTGMSGTVGAGISSTELIPRKDTLFCKRETSPSVTVYQYRKLFAKQVANVTLTGVYIELANIEESTQIAFGTGTSGSSSANPATAPSSVTFNGNYLNTVSLNGAFTEGSIIPIWIRQTIAADTEDDDFVSFQLRIIGTIA